MKEVHIVQNNWYISYQKGEAPVYGVEQVPPWTLIQNMLLLQKEMRIGSFSILPRNAANRF